MLFRSRVKAHIKSTVIQNSSGVVTSGTPAWGTSSCPSGVYVTGASPKCGSFIGSGMLQKWVSSSGGSADNGRWVDFKPISFTTTVYDGGWLKTCKNKTCHTTDLSDYFGIKMVPNDGSMLPSDVPSTIPIQIKQGQIRIF